MSNAPNRFESFFRASGERMVTGEIDTRVPNCEVFTIVKEDHTLANLIKYKLHENPAVLFAGYKVPHPMYAVVELRVQTDGSITPTEAAQKAARDCIQDFGKLKREFTKEMELFKARNVAAGPAPGAPGPSSGPSGPDNSMGGA